MDRTLRGYAAVFDQLSESLGGFRERIARGAFDAADVSDVRVLVNHDANRVLGRTRAKTLRLGVDDTGLWYEVDLPDTLAARDLVEVVERTDLSQSSLAFSLTPGGDEWREDADGAIVRTILKVARVWDVSPVTYPAYPTTTVAIRDHASAQIKAVRRKAHLRLMSLQ